MPDAAPPTQAQLTYTTNPLLSPMVIGGLVLVVANLLSISGIHFLDDPAVQQKLTVALDTLIVIGVAVAHAVWPHQDGRLSFTAPLSTPAPIAVPTGASVITVPTTTASSQSSTVQPLDTGASTVIVPPVVSDSLPQPAPLVLGSSAS